MIQKPDLCTGRTPDVRLARKSSKLDRRIDVTCGICVECHYLSIPEYLNLAFTVMSS